MSETSSEQIWDIKVQLLKINLYATLIQCAFNPLGTKKFQELVVTIFNT